MEKKIRFEIESDEYRDRIRIEPVSQLDGVAIYKIAVMQKMETPVTISFTGEMRDIYSTWQPLAGRNRWIPQWFRHYTVDSQFYYGAPIFSTVRQDGKNNTTVALSDCVSRTQIEFGVADIEEKDEVRYKVTLFGDCRVEDDEYCVFLRIDQREIPFSSVIKSVSKWYQEYLCIEHKIPKSAEQPLYSSWYNFHQAPKEALLLDELKSAKDMGFETVIIDDGWQFAGESSGTYETCGDWAVSKDKFFDFEEFVKKVHNLGMKVMLWFPVPFVGFKTKDYKKFADKLLYDFYEQKAGVLDVRYREVREYIVNIYKYFVKTYGLDGLKLDFVDSFMLKPESPAYNERMDCKTVIEGVLCLLQTIRKELISGNEDFMIEFRQDYVGAEIIRYCNMLRVGDCAYDGITNRIAIADLRMLHTDIAIHSDMLLWAKNASVEECARQLLNIIFSVPQISVLLTKMPKDQKDLVEFFIKYWKANKNVLLHGDLQVERPSVNYSKISSETTLKKITVLYSDNLYEYTGKEEDVFNNTDKENVCIVNNSDEPLTVEIFDNCGRLIKTENKIGNTVLLQVPITGMCSLKKTNKHENTEN